MSRKICVVTGSRAEYGLLKRVMREIRLHEDLELQIIVTGSHLSPEFGSTYEEIEKDGFLIDRKVEILTSSDTPVGICKSMGLASIGLAEAYQQLDPNLVLVLGDRFEILVAASAAMMFKLPLAHIHGGEVTQGAVDDTIRHCVTKMSHLHFVATSIYRDRVVQLGETPENIFVVGGLGAEAIHDLELMSRVEVEEMLEFKFSERNLLVTYHPETALRDDGVDGINELLAALESFSDLGILFTYPNPDSSSRKILSAIETFVAENTNSKLFFSLGQKGYLSTMKIVDCVVGNSSSGLLEAPSLKTATVNVGNRQGGRLRAPSVIDCDADRRSIVKAIRKVYSEDFLAKMSNMDDLYWKIGASRSIIETISKIDLESVMKKKFVDISIK